MTKNKYFAVSIIAACFFLSKLWEGALADLSSIMAVSMEVEYDGVLLCQGLHLPAGFVWQQIPGTLSTTFTCICIKNKYESYN